MVWGGVREDFFFEDVEKDDGGYWLKVTRVSFRALILC